MRSERLVNSDLVAARKIVRNLLTEVDAVNNRLIAARVHVLDLEQELKQVAQVRPLGVWADNADRHDRERTDAYSGECSEAQPDSSPEG